MVETKASPRYNAHPYLIYTKIPNTYFKGRNREDVVNNCGFTGTRLTHIEKEPGIKRIICVGGSTTESSYKTANNTYPELLQRILGEKYEVINAGVPGYTTAEILIYLELKLLDFKPDIVVIYTGANDASTGTFKNFKSDYTHARAPFGYTPVKDKNDLIYSIRPEISERSDGRIPDIAVETFKRNINSMTAICKSNNIVPIFVAENISQNNKYSKEFVDGVTRNVKSVRDIVPHYLKMSNMVNEDYTDGCHLNISGMEKLATCIAQKICSLKY